MRRTASDFEETGQALYRTADRLAASERYNPQTTLFSLARIAETATVRLRVLTARTVSGGTAAYYAEMAGVLGVKVEEAHDWIRITVPAILPKRNQRDDQAFLVRPLRQALARFMEDSPIEPFERCAVCIVHQYDSSLGALRVRDYDNMETKRYLDVIGSVLLTSDSALLCTVLQCTEMSVTDATEFYLMPPGNLRKWLKSREGGSPDPAV